MSRLVLITGGAGFIGSAVARLLVERGDRVRILDDLSIGRRAYLDGVPHELAEAQLADRGAVARAVAGADAVVHLAARAGIPDSVADPLGTFDVNVGQLLGVLDAARQAGVPRFVFASSN
ncbi:MAG TPA: NAD-dependent epimerase/dehydratase family protein, partial [Candidatus Limnocylindrales bacterium]